MSNLFSCNTVVVVVWCYSTMSHKRQPAYMKVLQSMCSDYRYVVLQEMFPDDEEDDGSLVKPTFEYDPDIDDNEGKAMGR